MFWYKYVKIGWHPLALKVTDKIKLDWIGNSILKFWSRNKKKLFYVCVLW